MFRIDEENHMPHMSSLSNIQDRIIESSPNELIKQGPAGWHGKQASIHSVLRLEEILLSMVLAVNHQIPPF